jgi:hypothetical protein
LAVSIGKSWSVHRNPEIEFIPYYMEVESLARVRRLLTPVQLNFGTNQVNFSK